MKPTNMIWWKKALLHSGLLIGLLVLVVLPIGWWADHSGISAAQADALGEKIGFVCGVSMVFGSAFIWYFAWKNQSKDS